MLQRIDSGSREDGLQRNVLPYLGCPSRFRGPRAVQNLMLACRDTLGWQPFRAAAIDPAPVASCLPLKTVACGASEPEWPVASLPIGTTRHGQHTAHGRERLPRRPRADLDARQEDAKTLRERCERAFAYCDERERPRRRRGIGNLVWRRGRHARLDARGQGAHRAFIGGGRFPKIVAGPAAGRGVSFDELAELILVKEARDVEPLVQRARAFFAEKCDDGQAVISVVPGQGLRPRSHEDGRERVFPGSEELEMSSLGALILAERLDINRDGIIDEKDALAWLSCRENTRS